MFPRTLLLFIALAGLYCAGEAQPTTVTGSFMYGGILRDHRIYIPALYNPANPVPLVFNLHGFGSNNFQQEIYGDFRAIADTANFIIVHPNGSADNDGNRFWNAFGVPLVDDLSYLTALIDTISAHWSIDQDRVYSAGMSNGGFMSYDLACYRSDRFAAIASVTGTMISQQWINCQASHPTPVMQIHGTDDLTVSYTGGSGLIAIEELVSDWAAFNNCSPVPSIEMLPDLVPTDGSTVEHWVYSSGDAGSSVELYKVIGGGHTWPGSIISLPGTNHDLNASKEIWRFFSQYDIGGSISGIDDRSAELPFTVSPNPSVDRFKLAFASPAKRNITVMDLTGKVMMNTMSSDQVFELRIDIPGVYLITTEQDGRRITQRVMKL